MVVIDLLQDDWRVLGGSWQVLYGKKETRMVSSPKEAIRVGGCGGIGFALPAPPLLNPAPRSKSRIWRCRPTLYSNAKKVPQLRDTVQGIENKHLAVVVLIFIPDPGCQSLTKCPIKVSHPWAVTGHRDIASGPGGWNYFGVSTCRELILTRAVNR
jgi:hypothetical protein